MVDEQAALPGRAAPIMTPGRHFVLGTPIGPSYPDGLEQAQFALGCFWGAERAFWRLEGIYTTAVGYAGGHSENPTYDEVCTGRTGHAETVLVVFDPAKIGYAELVQAFFEQHDPTQLMRQGDDVGTQYRSAIYTTTESQAELAAAAIKAYGVRLAAAGYGPIVTALSPADRFYFAEDDHQQYLAKNPDGYCGRGGTGIACPTGLFAPGAREAAS